MNSQQAFDYIRADIKRELRLAELSTKKSYRFFAKLFRLPLGGANFMSALCLLSYTEYFGSLLKANLGNRKTFDLFYSKMGTAYAKQLKTINIYNIFRCGLAHEYFVKKSTEILMFGNRVTAIGTKDDGTYYFIVNQYLKDFEKAVTKELNLK